jgi:hypothetical protein
MACLGGAVNYGYVGRGATASPLALGVHQQSTINRSEHNNGPIITLYEETQATSTQRQATLPIAQPRRKMSDDRHRRDVQL